MSSTNIGIDVQKKKALTCKRNKKWLKLGKKTKGKVAVVLSSRLIIARRRGQ